MAYSITCIFACIQLSLLANFISGKSSKSLLRPIVSPTRDLLLLDGKNWTLKFATEFDPDEGFRGHWYSMPLNKLQGDNYQVPVPASYPSLTQTELNKPVFPSRLYPTWAWYQVRFALPLSWQQRNLLEKGRQIFLRLGAAHYTSVVYLNGQWIGSHRGGSVPYVLSVPQSLLSYDFKAKAESNEATAENWLTIAVNDTLTDDTIPQGRWMSETVRGMTDWSGFNLHNESKLETVREFWWYAGITDSVILYTTPNARIYDVNVTSDYINGIGYINYSVEARRFHNGVTDTYSTCSYLVELLDKTGSIVSSQDHSPAKGILRVDKPNLWWPFTMAPDDQVGYLYTLKITLKDVHEAGGVLDVYSIKVGIRTIRLDGSKFYINNKPLYIRGINNEEFHVGRKVPRNIRAMNEWEFYRWAFANSMRNEDRIPLREEAMDRADELGILVINQVPAIELRLFTQSLLEAHQNVMEELIQRDKNRPSVAMWSLACFTTANDPNNRANTYFRELTELARRLDPQRRPLAIEVKELELRRDPSIQFVDIVLLSWHQMTRKSVKEPAEEVPTENVLVDIAQVTAAGKPILISEYGIHPPLSDLCSWPGPSEPQFEKFHEIFDRLRDRDGSLIGEVNWSCDHGRIAAAWAWRSEHYREGIRCRFMELAVRSSNYSADPQECRLDMERASTSTRPPCPFGSWFQDYGVD